MSEIEVLNNIFGSVSFDEANGKLRWYHKMVRGNSWDVGDVYISRLGIYIVSWLTGN